jgi:hypothetical protein
MFDSKLPSDLLGAAALLQVPFTFWLMYRHARKSNKAVIPALGLGVVAIFAVSFVLFAVAIAVMPDEVRERREQEAAKHRPKETPAKIEAPKVTQAKVPVQTPVQEPQPTAQSLPPVTSTPVEQNARPTMKDLFDVGIPQARREDLARLFVAGSYHFVDRSLRDMPSVSNYTFSADGTLRSSSCVAFGEVAERKFEERSDRWTIKEGRYGNTGMIYYGITFESVGFRPSLILDRDDGLLFNFDKKKVKMLPGTTSKCE